jgi:hypothetical protein
MAYQQNKDMVPQTERELPKARVVNIAPVDMGDRDNAPLTDSALILDIAHTVLTHYARFQSPEHADIATLWLASTWMVDTADRLLFPAHPRLFMIADKGSGKTRIMKITRAMSRNPTGIVKAPVTAPGLKEALDSGMTVFLDEVDRQIGRGMGHLDVQSVISAYEADTGSLNARGGYNEQNLYGPMMLAAKPRIVNGTGGYIEDLFERSFIITPDRWADPNDPIPDLDEMFAEVTGKIPTAFKIWAEAVRWQMARDRQKQLWPIHTVPKALTARQREISLALLAVADRAVSPDVLAEHGQDIRWAKRARNAVQKVLLGRAENGPEIMADISKQLRRSGIKLTK